MQKITRAYPHTDANYILVVLLEEHDDGEGRVGDDGEGDEVADGAEEEDVAAGSQVPRPCVEGAAKHVGLGNAKQICI